MCSLDKDHSGLPGPGGATDEIEPTAEAAPEPLHDAPGAGPLRGVPPRTEPLKDVLGRRARLADLIGRYAGTLKETHARPQGIDRHLVSLSGQPIARKVANTLTAAMLVGHAQSRRSAGIQPSTIAVDISLLRTVLEAAKDANILSLDLTVVDLARQICKKDVSSATVTRWPAGPLRRT